MGEDFISGLIEDNFAWEKNFLDLVPRPGFNSPSMKLWPFEERQDSYIEMRGTLVSRIKRVKQA